MFPLDIWNIILHLIPQENRALFRLVCKEFCLIILKMKYEANEDDYFPWENTHFQLEFMKKVSRLIDYFTESHAANCDEFQSSRTGMRSSGIRYSKKVECERDGNFRLCISFAHKKSSIIRELGSSFSGYKECDYLSDGDDGGYLFLYNQSRIVCIPPDIVLLKSNALETHNCKNFWASGGLCPRLFIKKKNNLFCRDFYEGTFSYPYTEKLIWKHTSDVNRVFEIMGEPYLFDRGEMGKSTDTVVSVYKFIPEEETSTFCYSFPYEGSFSDIHIYHRAVVLLDRKNNSVRAYVDGILIDSNGGRSGDSKVSFCPKAVHKTPFGIVFLNQDETSCYLFTCDPRTFRYAFYEKKNPNTNTILAVEIMGCDSFKIYY